LWGGGGGGGGGERAHLSTGVTSYSKLCLAVVVITEF
jgi:hypothetical protein